MTEFVDDFAERQAEELICWAWVGGGADQTVLESL
jgi:hypothetical protein